MVTITFPTDTEDVIDAIRSAIGRDVTFYYIYSSMPCPICDLDPVTNTSKDAFCIICSGEYWIPLYSGETVNAHITWGYSEQLGWVKGGQLDEGEVRLQIKYIPSIVTIVESAEYVLVDGKNMQIVKKTLRGVPELNRILIDLIEREK